MNLALLIVDMQKEFAQEAAVADSMKRAAYYIQATYDLFLQKKLPIVVIQDEEVADGKSGKGYAVIDDLSLSGATHAVSKVHSNAFYDTTLESILRERGVDTVVISGFNAAYCITATYFGAQERGFTTNILKGGLASDDPRHIAYCYEMRDSVSYGMLKAAMG